MRHIGRKLFHLLGGLGLLSLYPLLGRAPALWTYTALAGVVLALDIVRLRVPAFNDMVFRRFSAFIRKNERNKLTGSASYILGIGLSLLLYRTEIAVAAVCFLAVGDVAATAVGERYGKTKISGAKSLEGTLAFLAAAVLAGFILVFLNVPIARGLVLAGAMTAAIVELLPIPMNDNLTIPLASGGTMELIARYIVWA